MVGQERGCRSRHSFRVDCRVLKRSIRRLNILPTPDTSPFSVTLRLSENFPVSMRTAS